MLRAWNEQANPTERTNELAPLVRPVRKAEPPRARSLMTTSAVRKPSSANRHDTAPDLGRSRRAAAHGQSAGMGTRNLMDEKLRSCGTRAGVMTVSVIPSSHLHNVCLHRKGTLRPGTANQGEAVPSRVNEDSTRDARRSEVVASCRGWSPLTRPSTSQRPRDLARLALTANNSVLG